MCVKYHGSSFRFFVQSSTLSLEEADVQITKTLSVLFVIFPQMNRQVLIVEDSTFNQGILKRQLMKGEMTVEDEQDLPHSLLSPSLILVITQSLRMDTKPSIPSIARTLLAEGYSMSFSCVNLILLLGRRSALLISVIALSRWIWRCPS